MKKHFRFPTRRIASLTKFITGFALTLFAISQIFSVPLVALAATYTFTQSDWSGGASGGTLAFPTTSTTQYASVTNIVPSSTSLTLATTTLATTTSSASISLGTFASTTNTGSAVTLATITGSSPIGTMTTYSGTGAGPFGIAFDGTNMWTANNGAGNTSVTKITPAGLMTTYTTAGNPAQGIAFDGTNMWTANPSANSVTKITPAGVMTTYSGTGTSPYRLAFDGTNMWTVNFSGGGVGSVTKVSPLGAMTTYSGTGAGPISIAFDGTNMWTVNNSDNSVTKITPAGVMTAYATVGGQSGIAFDGTNMWTTGINGATKITPAGVVTTYPEGGVNRDIAFDGTNMWTVNSSDNSVTKVASNGTAATYTGTGAGPFGIAFDGTNMWTANTGTNSVTKVSTGSSKYASSGVFTSAPINTGAVISWGTLSWAGTTPTGTAITMQARSASNSSMTGASAWGSCSIAGGANLSTDSCVHAGDSYIQYQASLSTTDPTQTPSLGAVTIGYACYISSGTLISEPYSVGNVLNQMGQLSWNESIVAGTGASVSLRVASTSALLATAPWVNFTDATSGCSVSSGTVTCPAAVLTSLQSSPAYWQYEVTETSTGVATPTISSVTVKYVINAAPDFNAAYGTNGVLVSQNNATSTTPGAVSISYSVRDTDTSTGTINPGYITPSFEYSTNGGSSWSAIPAGSLSPGDASNQSVNLDDTSYTVHTATWFATSTLANSFNTNVKIRVTANDNELANNTSQAISSAFTLDTKSPTVSATMDASASVSTASITLSAADNSQLQYRLCNDAAFPATDTQGNSCAWSALSGNLASTTIGSWTPLKDAQGNESVYVQARDAYGNATAITLVGPAMPANFAYVDVSNLASGYYAELVDWSAFQATTSATFSSYKLYKSTDGTTYNLLSAITDPNLTYYLDSMPVTTNMQYYKVAVTTTQGNTSPFTAVVSDIPNGYGGQTATTTVDVPPVISSIATSSVLSNTALVTFTTDKLATSTVLYGTTYSATCAYAASQSTSAFSLNQSVSLTGLNANTQYYFCVKAADVAGTVGTPIVGGSFTTAEGPLITNVHLGTLGATTAEILWNTATSSDSYVYYSTSASLANPQNAGVATSTQSHQVTLTDLVLGVPYYFYVKSTDSAGNFSLGTDTGGAYFTIPGKRDVTPPVISGITAPVQSATTAAIVWKTDKNATSQVYYDTSSDTSSGIYPKFTATDPTLSIYHVMTLSSTTLNAAGGATDPLVSNNLLAPNTTYYFVVVSTDASGNTATSSEQTFSTNTVDVTPPVISAIDVASSTLKSTSVVVTFTTNEVATSTVQYRVSNSTDPWTTIESNAYDVSHSVTLTGLSPNTTYLYQVRAGDAVGNMSNYVSGASATFTTTGGPIITNVLATNLAGSTATITWNTSTSSDSYVFYATNTAFTDVATVGSAVLVGSSAGVYPHQINLSNLSANTTYDFYVKSTDSNANATIRYNAAGTSNGTYYTFTMPADTTPPVISSILVPVTSASAAVVTWKTDKLSTSQVEYGTVASTTAGTYSVTTAINPTLSLFHVATLSAETATTDGGTNALTKSTTYYYRVKSVDSAGNSAESAENSFTTTADGATVVVVHGGSGSSAPSAPVVPPAPQNPTTPPSILSVVASSTDSFSASVMLTTDRDVTAGVQYGTSADYGSTEADFSFSSSKTITLKKLSEGTTYHYRVVVFDRYGNTATSNDQTFTTSFISESLDNRTLLQKASDVQGKIEQLIQSALPSLSPPFLTTPVVSSTTQDSATVTWTTNIKTYGSLRYATDDEYISNNDGYGAETSDGQNQSTSHTVTLTNLKSNTLYHLQARSYVFPQVVGSTPDVTFMTKAAPVTANVVAVTPEGFTVVWQTDSPTSSVVEYRNLATGESNLITDTTQVTYHNVQIHNLPPGTSYSVTASGIDKKGNRVDSASSLTVTTGVDTVPPVISNFKVDNALVPGNTGFVQTVVAWQTDKLANSVVYYQAGAGSTSTSTTLSNKVDMANTFTQSHIVILPHLQAGMVYRIKITSTDQSGNTKSFGPTSIITPQQTQSVLDIIVKNFEDTFRFLGSKQ